MLVILGGNLLLWRRSAFVFRNLLDAAVNRRLLLACEIEKHGHDSVLHGLSALPERKKSDAEAGEKQPKNTNDNPALIDVSNSDEVSAVSELTGEELLREDVARTIHWHWPKYQQRDSHKASKTSCDES